MPEPKQPSPEEMAKMGAVAQAGQEGATGETPEEQSKNATAAMRQERDKQGMDWLSDEDIDRIGEALTGKIVEGLEERGAFSYPEPVQPPETPAAPPAPGEPAPAAATAAEAPPQPPQKQSWAAKFMGSS